MSEQPLLTPEALAAHLPAKEPASRGVVMVLGPGLDRELLRGILGALEAADFPTIAVDQFSDAQAALAGPVLGDYLPLFPHCLTAPEVWGAVDPTPTTQRWYHQFAGKKGKPPRY